MKPGYIFRKGILLSPPRPGQSRPLVHHPGLLGHGGHHGGGGGGHLGPPGLHSMSEFSSSGPASLPWGGSAPPQRGLVRPIPGRGRGGGEGATSRAAPQKDSGIPLLFLTSANQRAFLIPRWGSQSRCLGISNDNGNSNNRRRGGARLCACQWFRQQDKTREKWQVIFLFNLLN